MQTRNARKDRLEEVRTVIEDTVQAIQNKFPHEDDRPEKFRIEMGDIVELTGIPSSTLYNDSIYAHLRRYYAALSYEKNRGVLIIDVEKFIENNLKEDGN